MENFIFCAVSILYSILAFLLTVQLNPHQYQQMYGYQLFLDKIAIRISAIIATDISTAITILIGQVFYHLTISAVLVRYFYFILLNYSYQLFLYV